MKFAAALMALMATAPLIAATGTRNLQDSTGNALEDSSAAAAAHHRKLASEKYTFAGYGINFDTYWSAEGCENGNSFYLYASSGVSKYQSNGKPSKTTSAYGWGGLDLWSNCDATTATHTYAYVDVYGGSDLALTVAKKLGTASVTLDTGVFAVTETCTKICSTFDDDSFDDDWSSGEYCYYGDCTTVSDGYVSATISATLTATDVASTFSSKSKYSGPGYTTRYSSKGKERPASVALSFELDGITIDIPADAYTYGSIQQTSGGDVYKY